MSKKLAEEELRDNVESRCYTEETLLAEILR